MFNIKNLKYNLIPFAVLASASFCFSMNSEAKDVTVKTDEELTEIIENMTEDTNIKFDSAFQTDDSSGVYIYHESPFNLTIDANHVKMEGESSVYDEGTGNLLIENFDIDGEAVESEYGEPSLTLGSFDSKGTFTIKNSVIKNRLKSYDAGLKISGDHGGLVTVDNLLFEKNIGENGAALSVDSEEISVKVLNSTFNENKTIYGGAAIFANYGYSKLEVINSKFTNNTLDMNNEANEGAGAIYTEDTHEPTELIIKDSLFDNNNALNSSWKGNASAGAISFSRFNESDNVEIYGTTFSNNKGSGAGAIAISESVSGTAKLKVENNTFYRNVNNAGIEGLDGGGAILFFNDSANAPGEHGPEILFSKNNTYLENKVVKYNEAEEPVDVKGGAIGLINIFVDHEFYNDLLVGNQLEKNENASKAFENVYIPHGDPIQLHNLGFDNGTVSTDTVAQAYGKYPVSLSENGSKIKAGRKEDATVIPTIMIAPKLNATVGAANMTGSEATTTDQRGNKRLGDPDIGAIEISSIVYDSNGGEFTLAELTKYDGKTYYEGKNPKQYAKVGNPGSEFTIVDGKKVLKPVKANYEFIGWSDQKGDKVAKTKYNAGKKMKVEDQTVLYAIWKKKTYALKYFNNGKTTGTIPTQKNVDGTTEITIKSQGKMKRKGYTFKGWSMKPSATKPESNYTPGKKMKLVKNTNLYAVWRR